MQVLRVDGLPAGALEEAAAFHAEWLGKLPPLLRRGTSVAGGGAPANTPDLESLIGKARSTRTSPSPAAWVPSPEPQAAAGQREDVVLIFPPADHTHRAWRLAAVQSLAREFAPLRVNALASDDPAAITAALAYLNSAPGLTGQYLALDGIGAGYVIPPAL